jgi:PAS domain S-box-containing protein
MNSNSNDYSKLFHLSPFPQWVFELATCKILEVNKTAVKHYGYSRDEFLQLTIKDLGLKEEIPKLLNGHADSSTDDEYINFGVFAHQKKSGEKIRMRISGQKVNFWGKDCVIAICQEVTEQKNKEREKELLSKISLNFRIENNLIASANELCDTISSFGKFDFVELWLPNVEYTQIQLFAHKSNSLNAGIFYEFSKDVQSIHLGKDLLNAAWIKRSSILWGDLDKNNDFSRKDAAGKAGIKTALKIPLLWAEKVVGLLVIGTRHEIGYLKKHLKVFEQLERFIGSEISRKKLENDLHHLYEAIPDILCLGDFQGRLLKINKSGCELLGYTEEELLFHSYDEFVHPDDLEISTNEVLKLGEGQSVFNFENRYLTKNGDIVWLSWTCSSSMEEGLIYATAKNITEEKKLRELNRQVNSLAKIGYWEVDLIREKLFWSDIVHQIHETDPKSFVPDLESAINFYREDFREMVQASIEKCIQTGKVFDFEALLVTAKGNERWVRALGSAEIENGECKRIYGGFQDIHEQKIIEHQKISLLSTLENSLNEIYIFDAETFRFNYVNKGALSNLGYSEHEIKLLTPLDLKPKFSPASFNKLVAPLITNENDKILFYTYHKRKNGSLYPVEVHLQFLKEGINKRFLAVILDITQRKKAEEQLIASYKEKNNIIESITDAFFTVDRNFIVSYWNAAAEESIGVKRDLLIGKNLWEVFPEATSLPSYKNYHQAMASGETIKFEEYNPVYDKWFSVSAYPAKEGLTVYFRDETLRKKAEIRLLQANERFEKATEATNDAIWDWNIVDNELYWGGNFRNQLGYDLGKIAPTLESWANNVHPDEKEWVVQSIEEVLDKPDQTNWIAEYRYQKFDGTYADVVDRGVIIRDDNGKATRMVGAMTDISERKSFEKQLLELNKSLKQHAHELELTNDQLEQFAFITSHDLQEPLRMITSFLDQLKRKYGGQLDEKAHQYIHFATDGAKRMKEIILDLLEYSRAGKQQENRVEIDLEKLISDYKSLRKKIITEKSVTISHPPLPVIEGFRAPLTQVVHCLMDNAIKYSKEGIAPQIELGIEESERDWTFSVRDNGLGIASEFFDKIFIIFQRLHNRDQYDGSGIGLAIVKKQVESWGGKVWLESAPGQGSAFFFTLPK